MTKSELAVQVSAAAGINQAEAVKAIEAVVEGIKKAVAEDEEVTLRGFGTFKRVYKQQKQGRNIRTGEPITIAAHYEPVFKASKEYKQAVR